MLICRSTANACVTLLICSLNLGRRNRVPFKGWMRMDEDGKSYELHLGES